VAITSNFAKPPSYKATLSKAAKKKKKPSPDLIQPLPYDQMKPPSQPVGTPAPPKPPTAPAANNNYPPPPVKAPQLPSSIAENLSAETDYSTTESDVNKKMYDAALRYGDPNAIRYYASQGYGPYIENPNGALASIQRQLDASKKSVGLQRNEANTFFSGMHVDDLQQLNTNADLQRLAAKQEYDQAIYELGQTLLRARQSKDARIAATGAADIEAALNNPPEARDDSPAPNVAQPSADPNVKISAYSDEYPHLNPKTKKYYKIVKKGNKTYHVYADGHQVLVK